MNTGTANQGARGGARQGARLLVVPSGLRRGPDGRRAVRLSVRAGGGREVTGLRTSDFVVWESGMEVTGHEVREHPAPQPIAAGFLLDAEVGEWGLAALEVAAGEARAGDRWVATLCGGGTTPARPGGPEPLCSAPRECIAAMDDRALPVDRALARTLEALRSVRAGRRILFALAGEAMAAQLAALLAAVEGSETGARVLAPAALAAAAPAWAAYPDLPHLPGLAGSFYRDEHCRYKLEYGPPPGLPAEEFEVSIEVACASGTGRAVWMASG